MTKVALVGCAHIHTPKFVGMLLERDDVRVGAVWDHDVARAAHTAGLVGAPSVQDLGPVWSDDTIDAVVICSETDRHADLVGAALDARKHLFVEKPLAVEGDLAELLAAAIERSGLLFSTGFFMRGSGVHRFLRDEITKGNFGTITHIDVSIAHAGALAGWFDDDWRWMADPIKAGYGALGDLGIHGVDMILWLLSYPSRPERVAAWTGSASGRYDPIDQFGRGQMVYPGGLVASIWGSWVDLANPWQLAISGTEGHAVISDGRLTYRRGAHGEAAEVTELPVPPDLGHAFDLFLDAIGGDPSPTLIGASEAANCSSIIEAFYRAAREDRWVPITGD